MCNESKKETEKTMPSTGPHRFTMKSWIGCAPFEQLLHMKIMDAAGGKATLTMPFFVEFAQGAGLMHGGALTSLADTAVVMAIKSVVPPKTHFATICLESQFLRPVTEGIVTAKARVVRQDERTLEGEATIYDASKRPVVRFFSTFKMAKKRGTKEIVLENGSR
jgi:uncharacterized protein (TIGR00369 family)